jgi:hypothetical protein
MEMATTDRAEIDFLDSAKHLYLRELSEPGNNSLRLVVQEAVVNLAGVVRSHPELPDLDELTRGASPIESTEGCRSFELTWKRYVAYLVTEECVGSCGTYDDELFSGQALRVYTKSHFLEHLARDTGGHIEKIMHYKLTCLNHLIDIAAYAPPEIKQVGSISSTIPRIHDC